MLELVGIDKVFNAGTVNETIIFDNFSMSVKTGAFISIVGSNGSGKTTLLNIISGSIPIDDGRIILDGEDKPFECVGTKDEVRLSLEMAWQRRKSDPPALLKRWRELFPEYTPVSLYKFFDTDNFVPEKLKHLLGEEYEH